MDGRRQTADGRGQSAAEPSAVCRPSSVVPSQSPIRNPQSRRGILFVLSGPSGVGKDTVLARLRELPGAPERCVTATTRAPREGEVPGRSYLFLSVEEFTRLREAGGLLEWARVHGNWYGTLRASVEERLAAGEDVIVNIDVQGGRSVRETGLDAVMIFLLPPSWEELERRLRSRGTDSEAAIERRLADARGELAEREHYAYWVVNDDADAAAAEVAAIVTAERCRARRWEETPGARSEGERRTDEGD
jgi:guanylate kinase